ncbi:MAG: DUF1592 domain-containing protein [Verrucomicrobiaceae bacterium]|nr:DUF1592 domain-containing protein [Verrucomicrobiaceae bacterium]
MFKSQSYWRHSALAVCCIFTAPSASTSYGATASDGADAGERFRAQIEPILSKVCYDCHADGVEKGDFSLDDFESIEEHLADRKLWLKVWENLRAEMMPPAEKTQPSHDERLKVIAWIEKEVFKLDANNPDPGRVTIRRMNRVEYEHTVKDLLDVDFDAEEVLPADDTGYGFDTIGDVLSISPMLMEKYLEAARQVVSQAIVPQDPVIPSVSIEGEKFKATAPSKKTGKYLSFAQGGQVSTKRVIEHPGDYRFSIECRTQGSSEATSHSANLRVLVNGKDIGGDSLGWDNRKSITITAKGALGEGENILTLALQEDSPPQPDEKPLSLVISKVKIQGPLDGSYKVYPKDYYRIFFKGGAPKEPVARQAYTKDILRRIADRAFRRPVDDGTLDRLVKLSQLALDQPNAKFEDGIAYATTAILASPRFLFRAEIQPEPDNAGKIVPLDEYALASRLSYFLWSSLPDEELMELARKGELRENLDEQIDRLLADKKSQRFVENFVGQWLQTRDIEGVNVDPRRVLGIKDLSAAFKVFGSRQRRGMRLETETLFAFLLKENRSALELFTADYTFLNESLAKFYGITGVKGDEMQKVALPKDSHRGGILTHGSLLVVTSNPTRTSPVKRGLFVLENLLGTPAPPAPPNVPTLEDQKKKQKKDITMREMMEIHREKPLCASCHARMDPLGLALENFNAVGMFRADENGSPIQTGGQLITGEKFNTIAELNQIFATSRRTDFYRCLTSKLLTYATGRGMEYYDAPTIDHIVADLEQSGGRLRTLIRGVVHSAPFQKRRGDGSVAAK